MLLYLYNIVTYYITICRLTLATNQRSLATVGLLYLYVTKLVIIAKPPRNPAGTELHTTIKLAIDIETECISPQLKAALTKARLQIY